MNNTVLSATYRRYGQKRVYGIGWRRETWIRLDRRMCTRSFRVYSKRNSRRKSSGITRNGSSGLDVLLVVYDSSISCCKQTLTCACFRVLDDSRRRCGLTGGRVQAGTVTGKVRRWWWSRTGQRSADWIGAIRAVGAPRWETLLSERVACVCDGRTARARRRPGNTHTHTRARTRVRTRLHEHTRAKTRAQTRKNTRTLVRTAKGSKARSIREEGARDGRCLVSESGGVGRRTKYAYKQTKPPVIQNAVNSIIVGTWTTTTSRTNTRGITRRTRERATIPFGEYSSPDTGKHRSRKTKTKKTKKTTTTTTINRGLYWFSERARAHDKRHRPPPPPKTSGSGTPPPPPRNAVAVVPIKPRAPVRGC